MMLESDRKSIGLLYWSDRPGHFFIGHRARYGEEDHLKARTITGTKGSRNDRPAVTQERLRPENYGVRATLPAGMRT